MDTPNKIIFFDGDCMLCNRFIGFTILKNIDNLYFSELQSKYANELLKKYNIVLKELDTIYFYRNGKLYNRSTAVLEIVAEFNIWYKLVSIFSLVIPKFIRDWIYNLISRNRHHIFKKYYCLLPTPKQRKMILE